MIFQKFLAYSRIAAGVVSAFALTDAAFATTCTPSDWVPGFCDLPVAPSARCIVAVDNWVARGACVAGTVGCAEIGGCFGSTPVGNWFPFVDNSVQKRCQCGCFAEETEFFTEGGVVTGTEVIAEASKGGMRLLTLDSLASRSLSGREVNNIKFGPEKELVFVVVTEAGRKVTVSSQHPVLIVDEAGDTSAVKAASKVEAGEYVLGEDGVADRITSIEKRPYDKRMVNFNVASEDAQQHFLPANGIILGDNAWQQRLASVDARILLRADLVKELSKQEGLRK